MYEFRFLTDDLLLITWKQTPPPQIAKTFLADLKQLLDDIQQPVYILSDLRKGRIIDLNTLKNLGKLTQHPNWAGSTAFSENPMSVMFSNIFAKGQHVKSEKNKVFDQLEDALGFLEALQPGVTRDVDWQSVLNLNSH